MRGPSAQTALVMLICLVGCAPASQRTSSSVTNEVETTEGEASGADLVVQTPQVVFQTSGGDVVVRVEVAQTRAERSKGLMYREHLEPSTGMLFIFERSDRLTFWMKNTLIPLDMIFVSHGVDNAPHRVVGIVANAVPHDLNPRGVDAMSRYVVEVPGGWAEKAGIHVGDVMRIEGLKAGSAMSATP